MQKVLLISPSSSFEDRIGEILDSPRFVSRVSSWAEARRVLSRTTPQTVLVDSKLADQQAATQMVQLNDVLTKDDKKAYVLDRQGDGQLDDWTRMFDAVDTVLSPPKNKKDWKRLRRLLRQHLDATPGEPGDEGADESSDDTDEVLVRLPSLDTGSLSNTPLTRLLYSLHIRETTGLLELTSDNIRRRFAFDDGRFVQTSEYDDVEALTSAYAWPDGDFSLEHTDIPSGSSIPPYQLMHRGLSTHRKQRQLMNGLMNRMDAYPVVTDLWPRPDNSLTWELLEDFLNRCDGQTTLETVFGHFGNRVTEAFRCAAFARDTDLIVFRADGFSGTIEVDYENLDPSGASTSSDDSETADGSEPDERQLQSLLDEIDSQSAHEVFGVWEGCGREVVKQQYYSLVKDHHPDAYGGNVSTEIQQLAQQIFLNIREAYNELLKTEDEQTVPPPDERNDTQQPGRQQRDTLHAKDSPATDESEGLADESSAASQQPGRTRRSSTPIGLGREPSSAHPEVKDQKRRTSSASGRTTRSDDHSAPSQNDGPDSEATTTDSSSGGQDDEEVDKRREKLQRLQRSSSRPRRTTSAPGSSSSSIPSPDSGDETSEADDPEKRAQKAFNKGYKHYKNERYKQALPLFEEANELDDDHGLYMTFLANTLFQLEPDKADRCIKLLRKAIKTEHRQALPDAHLFLGNILKVKDRERRAYKHFRRALDLNPGCRDAEREIRLYERRHNNDDGGEDESSNGFFKKLFKK